MECPACGYHVESGTPACLGCGATISAHAGVDTVDTADAGPPPPPPPPPPRPAGGPPQQPWLPPALEGVPFEDESRSFFDRLFATVKAAIVSPVELFSAIKEGGLGAPLVYALVIGTVANVMGGVWNLLINSLGLMVGSSTAEEKAVVAMTSGVMILGAPVLALIGVFVQAGMFHLGLMLLGGARRDFSVTFRAVAYALGPSLLAVVPACGGIVGGLWTLVLTILGATYAHRTDGWRAVVAYFLPLVACCCLAAAIFGLIGMVIAGAGAGSGLPNF